MSEKEKEFEEWFSWLKGQQAKGQEWIVENLRTFMLEAFFRGYEKGEDRMSKALDEACERIVEILDPVCVLKKYLGNKCFRHCQKEYGDIDKKCIGCLRDHYIEQASKDQDDQ